MEVIIVGGLLLLIDVLLYIMKIIYCKRFFMMIMLDKISRVLMMKLKGKN